MRKLFLLLILCYLSIAHVCAQRFTLISSTSDLASGSRYIIASMTDSAGMVMKNYVSGNNCGAFAATSTEGVIEYQSGMAIFTLGKYYTSWTFHDGTYYLDATSNQANYLKGNTSNGSYCKFTISFEDDKAVITCNNNNKSDYSIKYNSSNKLFSCYKSEQKPVYLYKEIPISSLVLSGTPQTEYYVGDVPTAQGITVTAQYADSLTLDVTAKVQWTITPSVIAADTDHLTITATYQDQSISTTIPITKQSIANSPSTPYTIQQARQLIDNGKGLVEQVYVRGIVADTESFDAETGTITYNIVDHLSASQSQLLCPEALDIDATPFDHISDLKRGTAVIVIGQLTRQGDTYSFLPGTIIVSKDETEALLPCSLSIAGTPATEYSIDAIPTATGMVVNAIYPDAFSLDVTPYVQWTFSPDLIEKQTTHLTATATYLDLSATITYPITIDPTELVYHLTPVSTSSSTYDSEADCTIHGVSWTVGGKTSDIPWRIGGKYLDENETDDHIELRSATPIYGTVSSVKVSIGTKNGDITLNRLRLLVADNPTFSNPTTYTKSNLSPNRDYTFTITDATNAYYKFVFVMTNTNSTNRYYEFLGAQFIGTKPETELSLTDAGYATFCLPYNATVPRGLTAYTATDNGDYIRLTPKVSNTIAAHEGIILKGTQGTYTFRGTTAAVSPTADNLLVGTTSSVHLTAESNAYMLTRNKETQEVAFRLLQTDYTIPANRSYLLLSTPNNTRSLISVHWDDAATTIHTLPSTPTAETTSTTATVYTLSGQRLSHPQQGINIVNGKLLIIK